MKHVIFWSIFTWMKRNIIWIFALYVAACLAIMLMQGDGR